MTLRVSPDETSPQGLASHTPCDKGSTYSTSVVDTTAGLMSLRTEWQDLVHRSSNATIFATFEWMSTWWRTIGESNGRRLYTIIVRDEHGTLRGIAPFCLHDRQMASIATIRVLTFLGSDPGAADHLDLISTAEDHERVAQIVTTYLLEQAQDWGRVDLFGLAPTSALLEAVRAIRDDITLVDEPATRCPYLILHGTWDDYLRDRSRAFRKNVLRYRRRVEKANGSIATCTREDEVDRALERLFELNPRRWNDRGDSSVFARADVQTFHRTVAQQFLGRGWLDLSYVKAAGTIVAVDYNFRFGGTCYAYNAAFESAWQHHSVGKVLMSHGIERAFTDGLREFDFLRGDHEYKSDWTTSVREDRHVIIPAGRRAAQALLGLERGAHALRRRLFASIPTDLQPRLKRALRRLRLR